MLFCTIDNIDHYKKKKRELFAIDSDQVHNAKQCAKTYWSECSDLESSLSARQKGDKKYFLHICRMEIRIS